MMSYLKELLIQKILEIHRLCKISKVAKLYKNKNAGKPLYLYRLSIWQLHKIIIYCMYINNQL